MKRNDFFIIGDVAKICDISTQTLRHYDKINFMKPDFIDPDNGYRYYSTEKLLLLLSTKCLKNVGFSLLEIKEYHENDDKSIINEIYEKKKQLLEEKVKEYSDAIEVLDFRIKLFKQLSQNESKLEKNVANINLKRLKPRHVIFVNKNMFFNYQNRIITSLESHKVSGKYNISTIPPVIHVIHSDYLKISSEPIDVEFCLELKNPTQQINGITRIIPGGMFITAIHHGNHSESFELYQNMLKFIKANGLTITGSVILSYLTTLTEVKSTDKVVFEIQIPVKIKK